MAANFQITKDFNGMLDDFNDPVLIVDTPSYATQTYSTFKGLKSIPLPILIQTAEFVFTTMPMVDLGRGCIGLDPKYPELLQQNSIWPNSNGYWVTNIQNTPVGLHALYYVYQCKNYPPDGTQIAHQCSVSTFFLPQKTTSFQYLKVRNCYVHGMATTPQVNAEQNHCCWAVLPDTGDVYLICSHTPLCHPPKDRIIPVSVVFYFTKKNGTSTTIRGVHCSHLFFKRDTRR
jgi:hypothetical protein